MLSIAIAVRLLQTQPKFAAHANVVSCLRGYDKEGQTIYGLNAEQFIVEDNGARQTVHVDEDPESEGLSLLVAAQCGRPALAEFPSRLGPA